MTFLTFILLALLSSPLFAQLNLDPSVYKSPAIHPEPSQDKGDIKAIFYDGLSYQGKPTRVFAYLGIPKSNHKLPAMVLLHGGGGTAFFEWVKIWNARGYAAISMDLEGHTPGDNPKHPGHDHSGPARQGYFEDVDVLREDQWGHHAVSDALLAHSLLRSLPEVDAERIGVTGISWGGVLTSLISGVDGRFKCAIPVYGCGYLYDSKAAFAKMRCPDDANFQKRKFWDPANYFVKTKMPTLWVSGDGDAHFSLDIFCRSHQSTKGPSTLTIHPGMPHGHDAGWNEKSAPEIYVFADSILLGKPPLPKIVQQPSAAHATLRYESSRPIVSAKLIYRTAPIVYTKSLGLEIPWQSQAATIDFAKRSVSVAIPNGTVLFYVNLVDDRGCTVSSDLIKM